MKIQKRKDIWLILAVILIVAALMAAITLFRPDLGSRAAVQIKVDGQEIGTYPLQENREIPVHTEYGYNLIVILLSVSMVWSMVWGCFAYLVSANMKGWRGVSIFVICYVFVSVVNQLLIAYSK